MKYLIILFLLIPTMVFAGTVCLEKSTNKLIEYQSTNAPSGMLTQNAISAGYNATNVIEKYVNATEWAVIKKIWIDDVEKDNAMNETLKKELADQEKIKLEVEKVLKSYNLTAK